MDNTGHHLKAVIRGKKGWARGWVMRPAQGSRQETTGQQEGQRESVRLGTRGRETAEGEGGPSFL